MILLEKRPLKLKLLSTPISSFLPHWLYHHPSLIPYQNCQSPCWHQLGTATRNYPNYLQISITILFFHAVPFRFPNASSSMIHKLQTLKNFASVSADFNVENLHSWMWIFWYSIHHSLPYAVSQCILYILRYLTVDIPRERYVFVFIIWKLQNLFWIIFIKVIPLLCCRVFYFCHPVKDMYLFLLFENS